MLLVALRKKRLLSSFEIFKYRDIKRPKPALNFLVLHDDDDILLAFVDTTPKRVISMSATGHLISTSGKCLVHFHLLQDI